MKVHIQYIRHGVEGFVVRESRGLLELYTVLQGQTGINEQRRRHYFVLCFISVRWIDTLHSLWFVGSKRFSA